MISLCFKILYGPIFSKSEIKGNVALKIIDKSSLNDDDDDDDFSSFWPFFFFVVFS